MKRPSDKERLDCKCVKKDRWPVGWDGPVCYCIKCDGKIFNSDEQAAIRAEAKAKGGRRADA